MGLLDPLTNSNSLPPQLLNLPGVGGPQVNAAMPEAAMPSLPAPPQLGDLVTNPQQQREQFLQSDIAQKTMPHPAQPGFWHKLGHYAAQIGNIAGNIAIPGTMLNIPGTQLNNELTASRESRELAGLQKQDTEEQNAASTRALQGAQTAEAQEATQEMPEKTAANIALQGAEAYRAIHPLATSAFELWHEQNPTGTAQDYETMMQKPLSQQQADSMNAVWDKMAQQYGLPTGQFKPGMPATDANALSASLNNVVSRGQGAQKIEIQQQSADQKVPMLIPDGKGGYSLHYLQEGQSITPGTLTQGGFNTQTNNQNKQAQALQDAKASVDYANQYINGKQYTGPGDEALLEKYFDLAKPSSGFRMTQQQIELLQRSRNWMGSVEGETYHAKNGTWFSDDQRRQIADTMNNLYNAKAGGGGNAGGPKAGDVVDGYRFKGGNPADQNSWEQVKK